MADRRGRRWSRAEVAAIAAGATFVVAGFFSGRLLDEHGGALGALEWLLRTLVVLSAIVFIVAAVVLVARVRRLVRWRPLGWLLAAAAFAAFAWFVATPLAFGVYLTHLPARDQVGDSDLGAPKLVERLSPRPLLLISAGRSTEADVNADLLRRAGPSAQRWHLPDAPHGRAIDADPRGYERRVIAFLDDALGG